MKKIIIGLVLLPLSFVAPAIAAVVFLMNINQGTSFTGPGTRDIVVEKPGKYYLWNQYEGTLDGKHFSQSGESSPDTTYTLIKADADKEALDTKDLSFASDSSISTNLGDNKRKSIGYFEVPQPGHYTLTISGLEEERLFAWAPSLFENTVLVIGGFLLASLIMFACIIGAIIFIILGIVQLSKKSPTPA